MQNIGFDFSHILLKLLVKTQSTGRWRDRKTTTGDESRLSRFSIIIIIIYFFLRISVSDFHSERTRQVSYVRGDKRGARVFDVQPYLLRAIRRDDTPTPP